MGRAAKGWTIRTVKGIYRVRFSHEGARPEISTGETDLRKATERAAEIYASHVRREPDPRRVLNDRTPLVDLVTRWIASIEDTSHASNTARLYEIHMTAHIIPFFRSLDRVTTANVADYQRARLKCVKRETVTKERSTLRSFLAWCQEQGALQVPVVMPVLARNAVGKSATSRPSHAVAVSAEQAAEFLAALPEWSTGKLGGSRRFPVRAFFALLWETTLRPSTLAKLSVPEHFTPGVPELRISKDIDKARFDRVLPLSEEALALLEAYAPARGVIFGRRDHREYVKAAKLAAKMPQGFYPYALKHSSMTDLIEQGASASHVAFLAGHKRISTTAGYVAVRRAAEAILRARGGRRSGLSGIQLGSEPQKTTAADPLECAAASRFIVVVRRPGLEPGRCYPLAPQSHAQWENAWNSLCAFHQNPAENCTIRLAIGIGSQLRPGLARVLRGQAALLELGLEATELELAAAGMGGVL